VKQWEPSFQTKSESPTETEGEEEDSTKEPEYLAFDSFDINKVRVQMWCFFFFKSHLCTSIELCVCG